MLIAKPHAPIFRYSPVSLPSIGIDTGVNLERELLLRSGSRSSCGLTLRSSGGGSCCGTFQIAGSSSLGSFLHRVRS
jgi:hypothetical protein